MSKGSPKFKELRVWQKGKDLAVYIYRITNTGDFARDYGLRDQIRRAVVSMREKQIKRLFGTFTLLKAHLLKY